MTANPDGYVTDVPYVSGFYEHLAPHVVRHAIAINKIIPPKIHSGFRYLELGCGLGRSLTVLAAANPQGEFVGVDVNPEHTARVEHDINSGKLANARVLTSDFASLGDDIGMFDFIALHGVYSWVAPEVRIHIRDVVSKHLNPGGAVVVSYNAMPGWSHLLPIRNMLLQYASLRSGDSVSRMKEALQYIAFLRDNKSKYFVDNPGASSFVDELLNSNPKYLVHEYFNKHWEASFFADVAGFFSPAGLEFVAGLPTHKNFLDLSAPPDFVNLFKTATNRMVVETHKDFIANTIFRWDIYVKSPQVMPLLADRLREADDFYFSLARPVVSLPFSAQLGVIQSTIEGPLYQALLDVVGKKGLRISELLVAPELSGASAQEIVNSLDTGVALGVLMVTPYPLAPSELHLDRPFQILGAFNAALLQGEAASGESLTLASTRSGAGFKLGDIDAGFLRALVEGGLEGLAERVDALLLERGRTVRLQGVPVTDPAVRREALKEREQAFLSILLPRLVALGVVTNQ
jgi:SAM-dependent methyltransferase